MSASRDPGGPPRPGSGSSDISAAAERARERLHSEMEQVRVSINELLADQDGAEESAFRNTFMERARGLSLAMLGIVTAVGLANPSHLAINQGLPLFGGGGGTPSTAARPPAADRDLIAQAQPAPGAAAPRVAAGVGSGRTFISGHPDLGPNPVLIVGELVPVGHTGTARKPPAHHGTPGPGGPPSATPVVGTFAPGPAPAAPKTIPAIEPEAGSGQHGPRGGTGGGPVRSGTDGPGEGPAGGGGDHDHGHEHGHGHGPPSSPGGSHGHGPPSGPGGSHGHGPPSGPGGSHGHGPPSGPGGSHGHGPPSNPGNSGSHGPPPSPGNSGSHGRGHGPPATAPPSTAPPSESAPPPPEHPRREASPEGGSGYDGPGNGHGNGHGPPGGTPPGQTRK